ncbi:MAG: cupredoxin domain-containing protein [Cyclobacteriaceae bacterium]
MKRLVFSLLIAALFVTVHTTYAQDSKTEVIKLTQVEGKFTKERLTLKPGSYIFEVKNKNVDKPVGLVVAPRAADCSAGVHIKEGYLSKTIDKGETARSQVVTLEPGTYTYFCPLNPTPEYTIEVKE